jgi:hypothetical protein
VGAESFLVLLDPNTWEEGFGEGMRQAKGEIAAKLAATPMNMLKASLAVVATGAVNRAVPGGKNPLDQSIGTPGKINPKANFASILRDQPNALIEGGVTMGIDSAFEGRINADDLLPGLMQAYLEEAKEGAITAHVASAHAGTSRTWVKSNLEKHGDRMTASERADYMAMHQVAVENQAMWTGGDEAGTNIFVSAEEYIRMREVAAMQAAKQWMDETGNSLSPEELAAFVRHCREAEDSREFARRMQQDPTVVAARAKIADDANKLDAELEEEAGLERDSGTEKNKEKTTTEPKTKVEAKPEKQDPLEQDKPTTKVGGGFAAIKSQMHRPVGEIGSEEAGHALLRRLAAGDRTALAGLQVELPEDLATNDIEWGLGRTEDGRIIVILGGPKDVNWAGLPGVVALAHSHPFSAEGALQSVDDSGSLALDALIARENNDLIRLLPSAADIRFCARRQIAGHQVHTPFIHVGDGKIANPGPGVDGPTVTFVIVEASYDGRFGGPEGAPAYRAKILATDGDRVLGTFEIQGLPHLGMVTAKALPVTRGVPEPADDTEKVEAGEHDYLDPPTDDNDEIDYDAWEQRLVAKGIGGDIDAVLARAQQANEDGIAARGELRAFERAHARGYDVKALEPERGPGAQQGKKSPEAELTTVEGGLKFLEAKTATEPPSDGTWRAHFDKANKQIKESGGTGEIYFDWTEVSVDDPASDFGAPASIESFIARKMNDQRGRAITYVEIRWRAPDGSTMLTARTRAEDGAVGPVETSVLRAVPGPGRDTTAAPEVSNEEDREKAANEAKDQPPQQPSRDLDELYAHAAEADVALRGLVSTIAGETGADAMFPPGLKGRERAIEKIEADYGGDVSRIVDLSRASLVYTTMEELQAGLAAVEAQADVVRVKNRFDKPTSSGYRDIVFNLRMPNGHIVELQLHLKQIIEAKEEGHSLYEEQRTIEATASREGRDLTASEVGRIQELEEEQRRLYGSALDRARKKDKGGGSG